MSEGDKHETRERWLKDIGFYVVATSTYDDKGGPYWVTCKVYEAEEEFVGAGRPCFRPDGAPSFMSSTDLVSEAQVFLEGDVKWDGCSNLSFRCDGVALHFCGAEQAGNIGKMLVALYDIAEEMMPQLAEYR